jgi:hypothetical protein
MASKRPVTRFAQKCWLNSKQLVQARVAKRIKEIKEREAEIAYHDIAGCH